EGYGNSVGFTAPGSGNIVSGNRASGVVIIGAHATGNSVQGNFIGLDVTGTRAISNTVEGVGIGDGSGNLVGGTNAAARNVISGNGFRGVSISGANTATNNLVQGNFIGTDLTGTKAVPNLMSCVVSFVPSTTVGGTTNTACDLDTGPNNLQNVPVVTAATNIVGSTTISGTLNSASNSTFALDFYLNLACDPSGFGEGQTFLGSTNVTTVAGCNAS